MTIEEVFNQLEKSTHPVAKILQKGDHFKVLVIAFKKGMLLKDHQTELPAKLIVLNGRIAYRESNREVFANTCQEVEIPIQTIHNVEALEDSLCILIQG